MVFIRRQLAWALVGVLGLLLLASWAGVVRGGPLDPPGTPGPTMKTLQEVEPRTPISSLPFAVTQSGSYYLTKNLSWLSSGTGIQITVDDVTIDLNGFSLTGGGGSTSAIIVPFAVKNIVVTNGSIHNWGDGGVSLGQATDSRVEDVAVEQIGGLGIAVGDRGIVRHVVSRNNGSFGVLAGANSVVEDSIATANSWNGFNLGAGSTISNCVATGNGGGGVNDSLRAAILASQGSIVRDCKVSGNSYAGIGIMDRVMVTRNDVTSNSGAGIKTLGAGENRIEDNNVTSNTGGGIVVTVAGNFVAKNSLRQNGAPGDLSLVAGNIALQENGAATSPWSNVIY